MEMILKKKRFLANIVLFYALLSYGYYFFFYIFQNFSNKIGFELHFNGFKMVEGLAAILLISLFYVFFDMNESIYLSYTYIFYMFILVPSASYYFLSNNSRVYFYMQIVAMCILNGFFVINRLFLGGAGNTSQSTNRGRSTLSLSKQKTTIWMKAFIAILGIFMVADLALFFKYGHSLSYLFKMNQTKELYSIRLSARDIIPNKFNYIISWSAMVIIPASIAWFVSIRKYYLIIIPAFLQALLFTIGGTKSTIFTLFLVTVVFIMYSIKKMEWFIPCMNYLLGFTLLTKKSFIMAVVIRRAFFFPQSISYNYYEFFKQYPQLHLSNSIMKHFFHNIYRLDAPFIISRYTYKSPVMSANTNFIANAYANFGFLGILSFVILVGILLVIIERICQNHPDKRFIIFITFCSFFALVNAALFTTLMTHGLLFSLVMALLFFYKRTNAD